MRSRFHSLKLELPKLHSRRSSFSISTEGESNASGETGTQYTQVTSQLVFGEFSTAKDISLLDTLQIDVIVNLVSSKVENKFPQRFEYVNFVLEDCFFENMDQKLVEVAHAIHRQISSGRKVFVHCRKGISRAPSTVAAYLIIHQAMSYKQAIQRITLLNNNVNINYWLEDALENIKTKTLTF